MKLRLKGNSLRCRLTQSEVAGLSLGRSCEEATAFGPGEEHRLVYRVERSDSGEPTLRLMTGPGAQVVIELPALRIGEWHGTSLVGIYFETLWGLRVAVEKDFRCLDPNRDEDESDHFDNPMAGSPGHACYASD